MRRIGEYELLDQLGEGGMGTVYRARHVRTGAEYALKGLAPGAESELLLRFQREGEALARVDRHPNVVSVHTCGIEAGAPYLVMDLATGGDLQQRLEAGPLPPREAAALLRDLARGLAHVHTQGVLHRDLKPHNILFDAAGTPRLVDFGLARIADAASLTATGTVMGTPSYMAPEQARGEGADERTDVYGLGAVLYAALTARPPFPGPTTIAILQRVLGEDPRRPSGLVPEVPAALERICLRALAKKPDDRYPSAQALADALSSFLEGRAIEIGIGLGWGPGAAARAAGGTPGGRAGAE